MDETHRVAVLGGSGYTGAELLRLLAGHPRFEVATVTAETRAGEWLGDVVPGLAVAYPDTRLGALGDLDPDGCEVVFCCLPHGASQKVVPELVDRVDHVVDLGADFRLPPAVYEQWYGEAHTAPDLCDRFAYALCEWFGDDLDRRPHAAVPGCYPTATLLALAPLVEAGVVTVGPVIVDACSGVSGAGRTPKPGTHFSEVDESVVAYGLDGHRHTGEMEHALARLAGRDLPVRFTPHLVPMLRGIHATAHARPARPVTSEELTALAAERYAAHPFVAVTTEPPPTKATLGANTAVCCYRSDPRTGLVSAIGVIDNLTKGAAGQAVQAANRLCGLPETTGLPTAGRWP
jgi:N-acetyl-gamma-glutamyl-phosphate reductase